MQAFMKYGENADVSFTHPNILVQWSEVMLAESYL